jgi:hypothetical protein
MNYVFNPGVIVKHTLPDKYYLKIQNDHFKDGFIYLFVLENSIRSLTGIVMNNLSDNAYNKLLDALSLNPEKFYQYPTYYIDTTLPRHSTYYKEIKKRIITIPNIQSLVASKYLVVVKDVLKQFIEAKALKK